MATARSRLRQIPIPKQWERWTQRGFLDAVGLARKALFVVQGWAANSPVQRAQLQGALAEALRSLEVSREEGRILRLRLEERPAQQRPHYPAEARLAILALRAGTGWTVEETARRFQVTSMTLHNWMRRLDETKESGLLALPAPINKYPDFVEVLVKQLGRVAPLLGKKRIADVLARAGLHLAPTTVARLRARKRPEPKPPSAGATGHGGAAESAAAGTPSAKRITSKRPHHVWNLDFTLLPTTPGWWVPWVPWSLLQRWPFCFWLGVVMDHYSRSVVAWKLFRKQPTAAETCALLSAATLGAGTPPKHLITDAGPQFRQEYGAWCAALGVRPRRGAVGKSGSIAVIERFFRSLKAEMLARLKLTPANAARLREEISAYLTWYHDHRPHQGLGGLTQRERLRGGVPARKRRRREPRPGYPLARGHPGGRPCRASHLTLVCDTVEGRAHLPVVKLRAAA